MHTSTYERTTLPSGVTVLSETLDTVRSVALGLWFAVGSRTEQPGEEGMSHFLEHMMFKGTPTRSAAQISEEFDGLGAELNAFTSKEYTCYYSRFLDEHLPTALDVLSDMVGSSLLEQDAIVSEKEVVLEEISRRDDTPDDLVHDVFAQALWPDHPIGRPILGSRETVSAFDSELTRSFHSRHYVTGDLVVAAAGNMSHADLVDLVGTHLVIPEMHPADRIEAPSVDATPLAVHTKDTEQSHIVLGFPGLPAGHPDRFALSILDTILGGGMSSRLFQEIREKRGLAYAVFSYSSMFRETGSMAFYCGTRPANTEQVVTILREEAANIAESGVTDEELHRAKESHKGHLVLGLENTRNRMTRLGKNEITRSEILSLDETVDRIEAVTKDEVRELAERLFSGPQTLALVGPFDPDEVAHLSA